MLERLLTEQQNPASAGIDTLSTEEALRIINAEDHKVAEARRLGAVTVGISCSPDSELARAAAIAITPLVGPEIVTGSTRMKAGTAQKLVLNMLSTGAFIRLGYVYGNLMVNVQPKNLK